VDSVVRYWAHLNQQDLLFKASLFHFKYFKDERRIYFWYLPMYFLKLLIAYNYFRAKDTQFIF